MSRASTVAVTGIGCLSAAGPDLGAALGNLLSGKREPRPPSRFTTTHPLRCPVFEVPPDFLPEDLGRREELLLTSRFALAAAREALRDAGWIPRDLARHRVGVCLGTTVGSAMNNEEFYWSYRQGLRPSMEAIHRYLRSNPADVLAREFGLLGPRQTVVNACSSGTDAVGIGASWIRAGMCDVVLAGGADELCRVIYNGFISLMITDDAPCRPFDRERRGLNLGEGAAVLVLELETLRRSRGARARAQVLGYGSACDAFHLTAPHPEGAGLRRAFAEALKDSQTVRDDVAFVNAHGTGTPDNDRVEGRLLAEMLPGVPFLSTKGYTGHTLGAAGAIEAAFTVACLEEGRIPASAGFALPDPNIPAPPVSEASIVAGDCAISDSLAFGGNNAVLVFGRGRP